MEKNFGSSGDYVVLARKWRPATFDEVVGQRHIVRSLQNAIKMNRVGGAYLFSGMRGVGKTSMARILAKSVNCEKGATLTPCGECANCREITNGSSLDVTEIDAASNRGIDEMREIRDHLGYAPVKCRRKVYIIDEVHMLTKEAFNAFLKSLEEPPPHTTFILATTEQNKVPETVLSRCQCFEFRALTEKQITDKLADIAESESIPIEAAGLGMIARRAEGSMRDAQSLLDQAAAYSGEKLDESGIGTVLGLVSREKIWRLLTAVSIKETDSTLEQLHDLYYAGYDVNVLIKELFEAVRTTVIIRVTSSPEKILSESADTIGMVSEIAKNVSVGKLQQFFDIMLKAEAQSRTAGNPLSVLEMALIKMIRLDDVVPVDEILRRLKKMPSSAAADAPPARFALMEKADEPSSGQVETGSDKPPPYAVDGWEKIKSEIADKSPRMNGVLENIARFDVEDGKAVMYYPADRSYIKDQCEKNKELIEHIIAAEIGGELKLELRPEVNRQNTVNGKKKSLNETGRKDMLENPLIQKAVELFGGHPGFDDETG